jgi:hypothetical protein
MLCYEAARWVLVFTFWKRTAAKMAHVRATAAGLPHPELRHLLTNRSATERDE